MLVTTGRPYGLKLTGVALLCQITHLLEEREDGKVAGGPSFVSRFCRIGRNIQNPAGMLHGSS